MRRRQGPEAELRLANFGLTCIRRTQRPGCRRKRGVGVSDQWYVKEGSPVLHPPLRPRYRPRSPPGRLHPPQRHQADGSDSLLHHHPPKRVSERVILVLHVERSGVEVRACSRQLYVGRKQGVRESPRSAHEAGWLSVWRRGDEWEVRTMVIFSLS
jgi:hypothetical protein